MSHRLAVAAVFLLLLVFPSIQTSAAISRPDTTRCLTDAMAHPPPSQVSIALVKPTFTSTPYSKYDFGSFYYFFHKHVADSVVTSGLEPLATPVADAQEYNDGWGQDYSLYSFFKYGNQESDPARCGLVLGANVRVVDDVSVNAGALFNPDGSKRFDSVVIGHEEYVTQAEYDQFHRFVAAGGRLVGMSGNMFFARVNYSGGIETLVAGHGWTFDGKVATASHNQPFAVANINWFGSNYLAKMLMPDHATLNPNDTIGAKLAETFGGEITQSYSGRLEVNELQNFSFTSIVASWTTSVKSYVHQYGPGLSICLCVYSEANLFSDLAFGYFLVNALLDEMPSQILSPGLYRIGPMTCSATVCHSPRSLRFFD